MYKNFSGYIYIRREACGMRGLFLRPKPTFESENRVQDISETIIRMPIAPWLRN